MKLAQKISRVIVQPVWNLTLEMHVKLFKEREGKEENFHRVFAVKNRDYIKLDLQSFMTLELKAKKGEEWSMDRSIMIDNRNIFHLIDGFRKVLDHVLNGDVFAMNKQNQVIMYGGAAEKHTVNIFNLGNGRRIVVRPAVITDDNNITYEGVILFINRTEYYVEMPIDAFQSLYYALAQANLFTYSQLLLNYYLASLQTGELVNDKPAVPSRPRGNVFDTSMTEPEVKSKGMTSTKTENEDEMMRYFSGVPSPPTSIPPYMEDTEPPKESTDDVKGGETNEPKSDPVH